MIILRRPAAPPPPPRIPLIVVNAALALRCSMDPEIEHDTYPDRIAEAVRADDPRALLDVLHECMDTCTALANAIEDECGITGEHGQ